MTRTGTRLGLILIAVLLLFASACTPAQIAWWNDPSVPQSQKDAVLAAMQRPAPASGCVEAMQQVWPQHTWGWAMSIMKRESGFNPSAKNRSSSASGCWQTLQLHAPRFSKFGYTWANGRFNAYANNLVAYDLYKEAGTSPWRL